MYVAFSDHDDEPPRPVSPVGATGYGAQAQYEKFTALNKASQDRNPSPPRSPAVSLTCISTPHYTYQSTLGTCTSTITNALPRMSLGISTHGQPL